MVRNTPAGRNRCPAVRKLRPVAAMTVMSAAAAAFVGLVRLVFWIVDRFQDGTPLADALAHDDQQLVIATALALGAALAARLVTVQMLQVPIRSLGFPASRAVVPEVVIGIALGAVPALVVAMVFVLTGGTVERFGWTTAGAVRVVGYGLVLFTAVAATAELAPHTNPPE